MTAKLIKMTATLTFLMALAACAGPMEEVLHDDPDSEASASEFVDEASFYSASDIEEEFDVSILSKSTSTEITQILQKYNHLDPRQVIPRNHLAKALIFFEQNKTRFPNQKVISILDFSRRSTEKRWHFVDLKTGAVWSVHVAHGKGSDSNHDGFAEKFSNTSGSNASSLGFYRTAETYSGKWGYSLRLDGLSSTNSNARARAVVIHGSTYVEDRPVIQGRSFGCPAVSMANRTQVINLIKGGSLIYAVQ